MLVSPAFLVAPSWTRYSLCTQRPHLKLRFALNPRLLREHPFTLGLNLCLHQDLFLNLTSIVSSRVYRNVLILMTTFEIFYLLIPPEQTAEKV